jgi:hypothetical protein
MRATALIFLAAALFSVTGCESDLPPNPPAENPLQRGIRGEGSAKPLDYSDDPFVREQSRSNY